MQEKLIQEIRGLNDEVRELVILVNSLVFQIKQLNAAQTSDVRGTSKRRTHPKVEELGLSETVIELFNKGLTYAEISDQLENQVSKATVGRFVKRYKLDK